VLCKISKINDENYKRCLHLVLQVQNILMASQGSETTVQPDGPPPVENNPDAAAALALVAKEVSHIEETHPKPPHHPKPKNNNQNNQHSNQNSNVINLLKAFETFSSGGSGRGGGGGGGGGGQQRAPLNHEAKEAAKLAKAKKHKEKMDNQTYEKGRVDRELVALRRAMANIHSNDPEAQKVDEVDLKKHSEDADVREAEKKRIEDAKQAAANESAKTAQADGTVHSSLTYGSAHTESCVHHEDDSDSDSDVSA
jgi:hypothetical protein